MIKCTGFNLLKYKFPENPPTAGIVVRCAGKNQATFWLRTTTLASQSVERFCLGRKIQIVIFSVFARSSQ